MLELEEVVNIENGIQVSDSENNDGPIYTGGANVPLGLDFPVNTYYTQVTSSGVKLWRKFGSAVFDWIVHDDVTRAEKIDYDIKVPSGNIHKAFCLEFNKELSIDGEVYIA